MSAVAQCYFSKLKIAQKAYNADCTITHNTKMHVKQISMCACWRKWVQRWAAWAHGGS